MVERLCVVIGCDVDPDRHSMVKGVSGSGLSWRGLTEGTPRLKNAVSRITDCHGRSPVFTWLIRADEQIQKLNGEYGWVLTEYRSLLTDLESSGDELGWHPHLWRWSSRNKVWLQDVFDTTWQTTMLKTAYHAYVREFPGRARSVRMGWDYHNNETMRALSTLGVTVDFSALPRMQSRVVSGRTKMENQFDWSITPRSIYRPSTSDYRRPARSGEIVHGLIEAPNFVSTSIVWGMAAAAQMARKMRDVSQIWRGIWRPTYWINTTGRPRLFAPLANELRKQIRRSHLQQLFFVTYFHSDELLENRSSLYSIDSLVANIQKLVQIALDYDIAVEFIQARQIPEFVAAGNSELRH